MLKQLPNWKTPDLKTLERFSHIKLIVVDLDGTLIHHGDSEPYAKIVKFCKDLRHNRYQVTLTIATGRTLTGARGLIDSLLLPRNTPLILYNGGLIVKNGAFEIMYKSTFKSGTFRKVIEIASEYKTYVLAYIVEGPIVPLEKKSYEYILGWSTARQPSHDFNKIKIQWQEPNAIKDHIFPSAILVDTSDDEKREKEIQLRLNQLSDVSITKSGTAHYVEIRPKDINKGAALQRVANYLKISSREILALGDNDNDAEMLAWAGIGVAINGATKDAIENSDFVCGHDAAAGAVEVLRLIKHARYYFFRPEKPKKMSVKGNRNVKH